MSDRRTEQFAQSSRSKSVHTTRIQFQIELEEGDRVRVIIEGVPEGETTAPRTVICREKDHAVRNGEDEEVPAEKEPVSEEAILAIESPPASHTVAPSPEHFASVGIQAENQDERMAIETEQSQAEKAPETQGSPALLKEEGKHQAAIKTALILAAVTLAMLPPMLIFLDRWRAANLANDELGKFWNSVNFFRQLVYPSYFLYIFAALIAVFLLVWQIGGKNPGFVKPEPVINHEAKGMSLRTWQRRPGATMTWAGGVIIIIAFLTQVWTQQVLGGLFLLGMTLFFFGWVLRVTPLDGIWQAARRNWQPVLAFLSFHIFLLMSLSSYYSDRKGLWVWVACMAISLAFSLYRYRTRIPLVLWVMSLALVLYTIRINGWEFSVIGDEYSFFMYSQELAKQHDLWFSINRLFNGVAVFGSHPFFSSFLQMVSSRLFHGTDFGWRFSSLYLSALALVFFYIFFRTFVKSRTALLAAIFLAASHYIMTFGKIGYNNLQAYFILSLVLASGAWAIRGRSITAYIVLGISLGACFYVYPAALYAIPIAYLLLLFYDAPFSRPALKRWGSTLLAFGILILPLILQKDYWSAKIPGTIFYSTEIMASFGSLASHFGINLLYAFLSFLYIPHEGHFVVSSYVDPLSGGLILVGLAYLVIKGWKVRSVAFILFGFATMLFFAGSSHDGEFPPNTRMFMLLPWLALLAAAGLEWLGSQVNQRVFQRAWLAGGLAVILTGVLTLNLYQAYSLSKQRSIGLQSPNMLFMRVIEHIQSQKSTIQRPLTIWFLTVPPWGIDGYRLSLTTYDIPESLVRLEKFDVKGPQLLEGVSGQLKDEASLVIIYPDLEKDLQEAIGSKLASLGKQSCAVKTVDDTTRFLLWYSTPMEWVCELGE